MLLCYSKNEAFFCLRFFLQGNLVDLKLSKIEMTIRLAFEKHMPWFLGPAGCAGNPRIPIFLNLYFLELTSFALLRLFKEDWCIFGDIVATRLFRENQMYSNVTLPYLRLVQLSVWGETLYSKSGTNFVVACVTKNSMNCLRSACFPGILISFTMEWILN